MPSNLWKCGKTDTKPMMMMLLLLLMMMMIIDKTREYLCTQAR